MWYIVILLLLSNLVYANSNDTKGVLNLESNYLGDIKYCDSDNNFSTITESYKNQNVIIVVCSDSCKPCIEELIEFNSIAQANQGKFNFLILNIGDIDNMNKIFKEYKFDALQLYHDTKMSVLRAVNKRVIPLVVFLNEDHQVQDIVAGYVDWNSIKYKLLLNSYSNIVSQEKMDSNNDSDEIDRELEKDIVHEELQRSTKKVQRDKKIKQNKYDDNIYVIRYYKRISEKN
ncbi:MAG: hypothetical protein AAFO15_00110 [Pseudomonadota bacterium]